MATAYIATIPALEQQVKSATDKAIPAIHALGTPVETFLACEAFLESVSALNAVVLASSEQERQAASTAAFDASVNWSNSAEWSNVAAAATPFGLRTLALVGGGTAAYFLGVEGTVGIALSDGGQPPIDAYILAGVGVSVGVSVGVEVTAGLYASTLEPDKLGVEVCLDISGAAGVGAGAAVSTTIGTTGWGFTVFFSTGEDFDISVGVGLQSSTLLGGIPISSTQLD